MSKSKDDAPHELESQFVLRLPPVRARSARGPRGACRGVPEAARFGLRGRHRAGDSALGWGVRHRAGDSAPGWGWSARRGSPWEVCEPGEERGSRLDAFWPWAARSVSLEQIFPGFLSRRAPATQGRRLVRQLGD